MTALEKRLIGEIDMMKRQIGELQERAGLNAEALDSARREDAVEHMNRHGDPEMIKEYLRSRRKTMCSPEFMTVVVEGDNHGKRSGET